MIEPRTKQTVLHLPNRCSIAQDRFMGRTSGLQVVALALFALALSACRSGETRDATAGSAAADGELAASDTGKREPSTVPSAGVRNARTGTTMPAVDGSSEFVLDPAVTRGLDPLQAAGLINDPGLLARGTVDGLVTFADLSLAGVNLDGLLDYLFQPETEAAKAFQFPAEVRAHEGEDRAVIGYMIPIIMKPRSTEVLEFQLVKDLQACCYGGNPRPDEWINVVMKDDEATEPLLYRPILVRGDLEVGRLEDDYGYAFGVYEIRADSVAPFMPADAGTAD